MPPRSSSPTSSTPSGRCAASSRCPAAFLPSAESRDGAAAQAAHPVSPLTARRIDEAVRTLLDDCMARATSVLQARRGMLVRCVKALMQEETLDESRLLALTGTAVPPLQQQALRGSREQR
ncbi:hypothetical protein OOT46_25280 [Aquabacterium sp. A7-Y]|uniref:hypothetical protein n=1 Tax=Aquabacterium sp. A7-Y TaxID=1349605 RepID=UPI00223CE08E|nr:hypothetical protein [Aquabacterium sp. A7-Y]MCW7541132.1 hypothetical protein [Aquabacterium sp. A7-Y]